MGSSSSATDRLSRWLLRRRWFVMLLFGLCILAFEWLEHRPAFHAVDGDFLQEVIGLGIIMPLLLGSSLTALAHARSEVTVIRLTTREDERKRLARDLHDTLGQNLALMRLTLERLNRTNFAADADQAQRDLGQLSAIVENTYEQVRGKLVELRPPTAPELGAALLEYARVVGRRANFTVDFRHDGEPRPLPEHTKRELCYFFREALTNIEKHAACSRVTVRLRWLADGLSISLADDGVGFDPQADVGGGHFGLMVMRERAAEINATLTLRSARPVGTELALWVPLTAAGDGR